jgi:O-acetyl-ADP-ribose deacetylase (regulator of RNase III)
MKPPALEGNDMCDRMIDGNAGDGSGPVTHARIHRIAIRTPVAHHADLYRALLGDLPGISIVDGPLLEGCIADAVIAPTNSFGYLDAGIDAAFTRRFGRRLQRSLQERIGWEFEAELPVGEAVLLATGDISLPFVVAAPATHLPGAISTEPMIYRSIHAALRTVERANATGELPPIESVVMPDIASIVPGWDVESLVIQLRQAIEAWRIVSERAQRASRAA